MLAGRFLIRVPERGPIRFREVIRTVANETGIEIEMKNGDTLLSTTRIRHGGQDRQADPDA